MIYTAYSATWGQEEGRRTWGQEEGRRRNDYWTITKNGVVRLSKTGALRYSNWRPIVDDADLVNFHRDLLRFGYWTSAR